MTTPTQFNIMTPLGKNMHYKHLYVAYAALEEQMKVQADAYEAQLELLRKDTLAMAAELHGIRENEESWMDILND